MHIHAGWSWLPYVLKSRRAYGLHSPFVYALYSDVIRSRDARAEHDHSEEVRHRLLQDDRVLRRTDYGSGKSGPTSVKAFTKATAVSARCGRLLSRLVGHFQAASPTGRSFTVLEIGTGTGLSALYMTAGRDVRCLTLEGCPDTARIAVETIGQGPEVRVGAFDETLPVALTDLGRVDFAFVDGNHREEPTWSYFNQVAAYCSEASCVVLHDIHWSRGMEAAWKRIVSDNKVTVSVDLFDFGLVFFRAQAKEHFVMRW